MTLTCELPILVPPKSSVPPSEPETAPPKPSVPPSDRKPTRGTSIKTDLRRLAHRQSTQQNTTKQDMPPATSTPEHGNTDALLADSHGSSMEQVT